MCSPRRLVPLAALLFCTSLLTAEPAVRPSAFVDTEPFGARLAVDGVLLAETTPVLLRGLTAGPHRLAVWKEGYRTSYRTVQVTDESVASVELSLPPESVLLAFPQTGAVGDGLGTMEAEGRQFRLPAGTYALAPEEGMLRLKPVFPDEGLRITAGWSLSLVFTAFVASAASDIWHGQNGWSDGPTMVTGGLLATTLLELPWYLAIEGRKARFDKEASSRASVAPEFPQRAASLSIQADLALEAGNLDAAEQALVQLVTEAPESQLVGSAWFRLARIHSVTGRRELALGEYRLVADTYPQAATYDRARKAAADLFEAGAEPAQALVQLELMTAQQDLVSPEDLELQKARLQTAAEAPHEN